MSDERTYKVFTDLDERFNLVPRSHRNIQSVCRVMCDSVHLADQDRAYYAQEGGIEPDSVKDGKVRYEFTDRWDKSNYLAGMVEVLFQERIKLFDIDSKGTPKLRKTVTISGQEYDGEELFQQLDREEVYSAFSFFLSRFGATLHDAQNWLAISQLFQQISQTNTPHSETDGEQP